MTVPKVTRPGTDIDISITIWMKGSGNVNIATAFRNNNGKTISGISKTYAGISGKLHMLKLKVPSDTPSGYDYHLDTICTGWIVFSKTIGNIQVDSRNASMFIQTDRPVYKPGDFVQFRAFGIKPSLDVIKAPIDVIIFDPLNNRVKQYLKLQEEYGVVSGFLQLSPETHHGRWTIEMNQLGQTQQEYIEVKEYGNCVYFNRYTFGKPVEGYALINVTRADSSDSVFVKFEKIRIEKSDGSSIESPTGTAKIIITYKYTVKVKESITTKTKLFFTKAVAVDKSGVIIQQVSFPKHADSGTVYIFSKGTIVQQGIFAMNWLSRKQTIRVTHEMTPSFKILVYYVRRYGEIVADTIILSIKEIFRNKVTMKFDQKLVEPGQTVNLVVKADPGSLVNILAVDKSVLLLGNANDVTANNVLTKLQRFTHTTVPILREWDSIGSVVDSGVDSKTVFSNSGVYVTTDCLLIGHRVNGLENDDGLKPGDFGVGNCNGVGFLNDGTGDVPAQKDGSKSLASPSRKRTRFPETWLWLNTTTNRNGVASLKSLVPDTITQWIATSFVVNPQSGLGVATEPANITTFQRFFMRLELPYSAIRGEILILQITVFNYMNEDLEVG
ncbi:CD109 [Mytilus coruscus]|uniref:CD109 n=1 Tax=Mytilus coruscus TaxID=42192 RepID=A0A6J8DAE5_MYTCO|nr:CD109 [Mytilus coruscus]